MEADSGTSNDSREKDSQVLLTSSVEGEDSGDATHNRCKDACRTDTQHTSVQAYTTTTECNEVVQEQSKTSVALDHSYTSAGLETDIKAGEIEADCQTNNNSLWHLRTGDGGDTQVMFQCEFCHAVYKNRYHFRKHKRKHAFKKRCRLGLQTEKAKPRGYNCKKCGRQGLSERGLLLHVASHRRLKSIAAKGVVSKRVKCARWPVMQAYQDKNKKTQQAEAIKTKSSNKSRSQSGGDGSPKSQASRKKPGTVQKAKGSKNMPNRKKEMKRRSMDYGFTFCGSNDVDQYYSVSYETGPAVYTCNTCGHTVKDHRLIREHVCIHTDTINYYCNGCGDTFRYKRSVERHVKMVCSKLNKNLKSKIKSIRSQRQSAGKNNQENNCAESKTSAETKTDTRRQFNYSKKYLEKYSKNGYTYYRCKQCNTESRSRTYMWDHITVHANRKNHSCNMCKSRFRFKHNLQTHIKTKICQVTGDESNIKKSNLQSLKMAKKKQESSMHTQRKSHTSTIQTIQYNGFKHHKDLNAEKYIKRSNVAGKLLYKCTSCKDYSTDREVDAYDHATIHFGIRCYICDTCGHAMQRRPGAYMHARAHRDCESDSCKIPKVRSANEKKKKSDEARSAKLQHDRNTGQANKVMCVSKVNRSGPSSPHKVRKHGRVVQEFPCHTCNRQFSSLRALHIHQYRVPECRRENFGTGADSSNSSAARDEPSLCNDVKIMPTVSDNILSHCNDGETMSIASDDESSRCNDVENLFPASDESNHCNDAKSNTDTKINEDSDTNSNDDGTAVQSKSFVNSKKGANAKRSGVHTSTSQQRNCEGNMQDGIERDSTTMCAAEQEGITSSTSSSSTNVVVHVRNPCICETCSQQFRSGEDLNLHYLVSKVCGMANSSVESKLSLDDGNSCASNDVVAASSSTGAAIIGASPTTSPDESLTGMDCFVVNSSSVTGTQQNPVDLTESDDEQTIPCSINPCPQTDTKHQKQQVEHRCHLCGQCFSKSYYLLSHLLQHEMYDI